MSSTVNIATGKGSASALAGAAKIPSSASPNGGRHPRNGTLIPGGKDFTKSPPATAVALEKNGRSRCSRSRSHEMNSFASGKVYSHDSANDPSDAGIDPFAFNGSRRDKSFVRSGSIKRDARIEGGEVFLSGRRKPTGLSTIIASDNDGHGGEIALDYFPRQEILLTGSGATAAPSNETSSCVSSRSGFGSGSGRRNSRRSLVEWFRDDGDDREGEKICCHGVTPARSRGSSAAVGDIAVAGVSGLGSRRDRRVLGNADDAVVEGGSRNRAGRKLADWVKGAGVDDSDGDTILSGNTSPKSVMTPSPVAFSPAYPPSVSRSEENAYRGIIPKYPESQSPVTETRDGWSAGRPIFSEKEQSAGQETDSLDTAGEAAAAAAAATVLAVVVDAPIGDERGGDMVDGGLEKENGAVAAGSENEITSGRGIAEAATAEAGATAVESEEGVPENILAVDVANGGEGGPSVDEVDAEGFGTWKWSTPVDEEPANDNEDLEAVVVAAANGISVGQDGRTPRAGSSKGLVPASASSPARVSDAAEGADAMESTADNAVDVPPIDNGRGVNGGGVSRRVASFPLSRGNIRDLRRGLDRRSSGRSGLGVGNGVRSGMDNREFGGNVSGGADSSGIFGNGSARPDDVGIGIGGIGSDGMLKGKSETESGGMQNGSSGIGSDGMLKGKSETESGGMQNGSSGVGSDGVLKGKRETESGGMQNGSSGVGSDGMLKGKSGTESGGMQNGSSGVGSDIMLKGKSGTESGGMQNGSSGVGSDIMLKGKSGTESGGIQNGSGGIESMGTGNSVMHGESGRRWRVDSNRALALKTRRSLSVGGSSKSGSESRVALDCKGVMTDGDEASELSPVGCEIAYMKQRSTIGKGDKSTGGRTLGSWPNKVKKDADSAKVIYLGDIDFDAPGEATATDILVRQHRTRVRVKRVKDKASANTKKKTRAKPRRRIRNGKPLHPEEDEVEYMLTIGMMLGLRVAVGRQAGPLAKLELTVEDFYQVDKYTFPPSGATGGYLVTPSHKLGQTFKFKDYAPKVFKKIREHFGVDKMRYMLSVAGNYNFLEFISNAKSGEFFFFSHDERFMIKTMKSSETKFLRRILPHYYEHVKVHPETFLVRFYGMYRVKMHHINRKVHFIVMNSVLDTYKEIHRTFDLKGSSLGRSAKPGEKVLKDNDLAEKQGKLHLGSQRDAFLKVVRADSEFLARMKIMDYSLLTGIHDRAKQTEDDQHQSPRRYSKFFNFADEAENRATPGFKRVPGKLSSAAPPKAYSAPVKGDIKRHDMGSVALEVDFSGSGQGEGIRRRNSRDGKRPEEFPSSVVYLRGVGSSQSEILREGSFLRKNRLRGEFDEALSETGIQCDVPASASEFDGPSDAVVPSDDDPTSGGLWSATGTGTEEDTGGDYTEGDGEYETPSENAAGGNVRSGPPQEISLSRCSTAQENLSHWQAAEHVKERGGPNVPRRSTRRRSPPMFRPTPEPRLAPPETGVSLSILRRADGGVDSETNGKRGRDIYFMGIIDILQEYNARKHGETFFKSLAHDRAEISCVDPQTYSQRFNEFLERHTD